MIRFLCPLCGKTLKAPDGKAGATVVCPRCQERSVCPAAAGAAQAGRPPEPAVCGRTAALRHEGPGPSLFSGMRRGERWTVGLAAGVGALSLLLAAAAPSIPALAADADAARGAAMILVPSCVVVLLVVLYGHWTGCPACGRWWARREIEKEFGDRELFDKGGMLFARSTCRTTYECTACRHRWSATSTDEYQEVVRDRPTRRPERRAYPGP